MVHPFDLSARSMSGSSPIPGRSEGAETVPGTCVRQARGKPRGFPLSALRAFTFEYRLIEETFFNSIVRHLAVGRGAGGDGLGGSVFLAGVTTGRSRPPKMEVTSKTGFVGRPGPFGTFTGQTEAQ